MKPAVSEERENDGHNKPNNLWKGTFRNDEVSQQVIGVPGVGR